MDDPANVGFVNPHPKGDGGADNGGFVADKIFLNSSSIFGVEACVVSFGDDSIF